MNDAPFYIACLRGELVRRSQRNPAYSLRSLARSSRVDVAGLSRVLSGKAHLSAKSAERLAANLDLDARDQAMFMESLEQCRKEKRLSQFQKASISSSAKTVVTPLSLAKFEIIADWYHYAILELTHVEGFRPNVKWISHQLGISETLVKEAVRRLETVGLLVRRRHEWIDTQVSLGTEKKHVSTSALRRRQKQILEKAQASLDLNPIEERNHTATTMAIDPSRLPAARQRIAAFQKELTTFLEGGTKKQVYELGVFLIPLQKGQN